jgi:hypothetical protein
MGARTFSFFLICASAAWGQQQSGDELAMPEWLAPFSNAVQSITASATQGTSTYTALARPEDIATHYQAIMATAGVAFKTQGDGIGMSITASSDTISAVIQIREGAELCTVKVSYAVKQNDPRSVGPAARQQTTFAPASSGPRREPLSPYARAPYTWIISICDRSRLQSQEVQPYVLRSAH